MNIIDKHYLVEISEGNWWSVPVGIIAANRARSYMCKFESFNQSLHKGTIPHFEDDEYNVHDWASNNMDWEDVKESAIRLPPEEDGIDYQEGWVNGDHFVRETREGRHVKN